MLEFVSEAIVLDKRPMGEQDIYVTLFTKNLGKITARAISARKITSKLNAHLEPLDLTLARFVYKKEYRLTDALVINRFSGEPTSALKLVKFINEMTVEGEDDPQLWGELAPALRSGSISYVNFLKILGFDPLYATCGKCSGKPDYFSIEDLSFWCQNCRREAK